MTDNKFVDMIEAEGKCGICLDVAKFPYTLKCGHSPFCRMCIAEALIATKKCPICKDPASDSDTIMINIALRNMILKGFPDERSVDEQGAPYKSFTLGEYKKEKEKKEKRDKKIKKTTGNAVHGSLGNNSFSIEDDRAYAESLVAADLAASRGLPSWTSPLALEFHNMVNRAMEYDQNQSDPDSVSEVEDEEEEPEQEEEQHDNTEEDEDYVPGVTSLTSPDDTRIVIDIQDAADVVVQVGRRGDGGENRESQPRREYSMRDRAKLRKPTPTSNAPRTITLKRNPEPLVAKIPKKKHKRTTPTTIISVTRSPSQQQQSTQQQQQRPKESAVRVSSSIAPIQQAKKKPIVSKPSNVLANKK